MTNLEYETTKRDPNLTTDLEAQCDQKFDWIADRRNRLNVATQETRFKILQNIIGHPEQLSTLKELGYFMRGVSKSTIRNHLETLTDAGVVARVELPEDQRTRDNPHVFYGLTEEGRSDLDDVNLLTTERIAQEATTNTEMPDDVEAYMKAPRPEWEPAKRYEEISEDERNTIQ